MATLDEIQATLKIILDQNKKLSEDMAVLKAENVELKKNAEDKTERIEANVAKWKETEEEGFALADKLGELKEELVKDQVRDGFFQQETRIEELCRKLEELGDFEESRYRGKGVKLEPAQETHPEERYSSNAKEERMDCYFGEDRSYSAVAMRRFVERYQTVKEMNMRLRITGWDDPKYRAGKIVLCLKGDAFDYVKFASSSYERWADNDVQMLEKLQDKFINTQAIEMYILHFEQTVQEPRETIGEFMSRLKRSVREAYDGDEPRELDRKVAWRFVSGLSDRKVRDKILDAGWMKNRQEAKELDDLQRIAEYAKRNDDTSRAMSKTAAQVSAFDLELQEVDSFAAFSNGSSGSRSKNVSSESRLSGGSNRSGFSSGSRQESGGDSTGCFYCKKTGHRWFHCPKRKREDRDWRPKRAEDKKDF